MKKEDLLIPLLKSKENIVEFFNKNSYDNEISDIRRIRDIISDIRRIRLKDIIPKNDRKEIKDKLYKIEHQRNITEEEKERHDE